VEEDSLVPVEWMAGFVEGEGTFTMHSHQNHTTVKGERWYYKTVVPTFQVAQKERQPLDLIEAFFTSHGVRGKVSFRTNPHGGAHEYRSLGRYNCELIASILMDHMHSDRKIGQMMQWLQNIEELTNSPSAENLIRRIGS
jgi:hypothetical protein